MVARRIWLVKDVGNISCTELFRWSRGTSSDEYKEVPVERMAVIKAAPSETTLENAEKVKLFASGQSEIASRKRTN